MNEIQNSNTVKYFLNKLVRDEIKNIVDKEVKLTLKQATQIKYIILRKLIEEMQELQTEIFHNLYKKFNILDELVDVFEVLLKVIQIWNTNYKSYTLNEISATVLQFDDTITETKPLLIVRKMYNLAVELLRMTDENKDKRIENINAICCYFSLLLNKLNIKFSLLVAARQGKQKYRGAFNRNLILTYIEIPCESRLVSYYDAKYKRFIEKK